MVAICLLKVSQLAVRKWTHKRKVWASPRSLGGVANLVLIIVSRIASAGWRRGFGCFHTAIKDSSLGIAYLSVGPMQLVSVLSISRKIRSCSAAVSTLAILHVAPDGSDSKLSSAERSGLSVLRASYRTSRRVGSMFMRNSPTERSFRC